MVAPGSSTLRSAPMPKSQTDGFSVQKASESERCPHENPSALPSGCSSRFSTSRSAIGVTPVSCSLSA